MRRIALIGNCGSGKSTLARQLADVLGLTHIELDALFHQAGWTASTPQDFQARISQAMATADQTTDGWTTCGNYESASGALHHQNADTIIWLDLPRHLVMRRVLWRTLSRAVTRQELWNGNREPLTNFYKWDPEQNILRWTWIKHARYRKQNLRSCRDGTWAHATVHRLCTPDEVADFLAAAQRTAS